MGSHCLSCRSDPPRLTVDKVPRATRFLLLAFGARVPAPITVCFSSMRDPCTTDDTARISCSAGGTVAHGHTTSVLRHAHGGGNTLTQVWIGGQHPPTPQPWPVPITLPTPKELVGGKPLSQRPGTGPGANPGRPPGADSKLWTRSCPEIFGGPSELGATSPGESHDRLWPYPCPPPPPETLAALTAAPHAASPGFVQAGRGSCGLGIRSPGLAGLQRAVQSPTAPPGLS